VILCLVQAFSTVRIHKILAGLRFLKGRKFDVFKAKKSANWRELSCSAGWFADLYMPNGGTLKIEAMFLAMDDRTAET